MNILKMRSSLSTAFHPQTDGQSERSFRTLQEMLRCFVSCTQRDCRYLAGVEFSFNNHVNDITKYTPFYLEYGQDPLSVSDVLFSDESSSSNNTDKFIKEISEATKFSKLAIEEANVRNAEIVDSKRKEDEFRISFEVMLSTENLELKPTKETCAKVYRAAKS